MRTVLTPETPDFSASDYLAWPESPADPRSMEKLRAEIAQDAFVTVGIAHKLRDCKT